MIYKVQKNPEYYNKLNKEKIYTLLVNHMVVILQLNDYVFLYQK